MHCVLSVGVAVRSVTRPMKSQEGPKGQEKRTPSRPWPPCEPRGYAVAKGLGGMVRRQSAAGQFVKKEQLSALQPIQMPVNNYCVNTGPTLRGLNLC